MEQRVSKQVAPMPRLKPGEGGGERTRTDGDLMVSVLRAGWSENMEDQASGRMKIVDGRASKLPNTTLPDTIWSEEWPRLFLKRKRRGDCSLAPRKGKIVRSSPKQKTTPKTTVDTEQFTRSKEHQLRIWQQQDTWRESRLVGMAGEANNAVSAYMDVQAQEVRRLLRLLKKKFPQVRIILPPSLR